MATKAEMQAAHERCQQVRAAAAAELQNLNLFAAVRHAESALPYQHASATFQRRFQKIDEPATTAVDLILRYAPACFLSTSITAVESWYESGTKTERSALPQIADRIAHARDLMAHAVELWSGLSASPDAALRPSRDPRTKLLLQIWLSSAIIAAHPADATAYLRVTDLRRPMAAKCSWCGRQRRAPQAEFLEPSRCPTCSRRSEFVLVPQALK